MNNYCTQCGNQCPKDELRCPRGREYFGIIEGRGGPEHHRQRKEAATADEKVILLLRKCGHYLHHNAGHGQDADCAVLLAALSAAEKETLTDLLGKCLQSWQA